MLPRQHPRLPMAGRLTTVITRMGKQGYERDEVIRLRLKLLRIVIFSTLFSLFSSLLGSPVHADEYLNKVDAMLQAQKEQDRQLALVQIQAVSQCHGAEAMSNLTDEVVAWTGDALYIVSGVDGIVAMRNFVKNRRAARALAAGADLTLSAAEVAESGGRLTVGLAGAGRSIAGLGIPVVADVAFNKLFENQRMPHIWEPQALIDNPDIFFSMPQVDMYWYAANPQNQNHNDELRRMIGQEATRCRDWLAGTSRAPGQSSQSMGEEKRRSLPPLPGKPQEFYTPEYQAVVSGAGLQ
jgi:hypothetical protein